MKCRYCFGGYCENEDVRPVELRTHPGGKWDGGESTAGTKCREYLRGHFRYIKAEAIKTAKARNESNNHAN